jgi:NADH-quinone oxidoreductase subunit N
MALEQLPYLYPLLALTAGVVAVLLAGMGKAADPVKRSLVVALLFLAAAAALALLPQGTAQPALYHQTESGTGGLLQFDGFSRFFLWLAMLATALVLILAAQSAELSRRRFPEFTALLLTICIGISLMAATRNLLMAYLAMEMVSLSSYVLTGFKRANLFSHEAALKYVIYGGVASGVMVFGISLLYGLTGSTSFTAIAAALGQGGPVLAAGKAGMLGAIISLIMILTGLCFKIAAVPFHMWSPDVYQGAPTPFTGFLSVAPKAAGFALLLRFLMAILPQAGAELKESMLLILGLISAFTMTLGNLTAINQSNIKRLLAFSSIAHAGYMLMGVVLIDQVGAGAVLLYLGIYLFMNLGAFAVVQIVADKLGSEEISAYKGLGYKAPLLGVLLSVYLFSLAGLPPLAGFIGKFFLFAALIKNGGFWYMALAVVGILNSIVGLFYYTRVMREMYMRGNDEAPAATWSTGLAPLLVVLALPIFILGLYWVPLQNWALAAVQALK